MVLCFVNSCVPAVLDDAPVRTVLLGVVGPLCREISILKLKASMIYGEYNE